MVVEIHPKTRQREIHPPVGTHSLVGTHPPVDTHPLVGTHPLVVLVETHAH